MTQICIEGWRGINHSYAIVNQWQLLELVKIFPNIKHKDVPFFNSKWNINTNSNGFSIENNRIIDSIETPKEDEYFESIYRISYPLNIQESRSAKVFLFGTSEYQTIDGLMGNQENAVEKINSSNHFIITPSNWSKQGFIKNGIPDEKVIVIPHGIDPKTFYPLQDEERARVRKVLGLEDDEFLLLSLGAMTPNKGIDLVLQSYFHLRQKNKKIKLMLKDQSNLYGITADKYLAQLKQSKYGTLMTQEALNGIQLVSQNLTLNQIRSLYGAADCYVSPYRAEGFNLTPLEAAACGTPIVVTKGGSTDDYFQKWMGKQILSSVIYDDQKTYLNPDINSLINSIEELIESTGGRNFEYLGMRKFAWDKVTKDLADLFTK